MPDGFVKTIDASGLAPGAAAVADVAGRKLAIINVDGAFHALDNACPHQEGPLGEGKVQGSCLVCPWHHWEFDIDTGEYLDDPTVKVARYETKIEDGLVMVKID